MFIKSVPGKLRDPLFPSLEVVLQEKKKHRYAGRRTCSNWLKLKQVNEGTMGRGTTEGPWDEETEVLVGS